MGVPFILGPARVYLDSRPFTPNGAGGTQPDFSLDETAECIIVEVEGVLFRLRRTRLCTMSQCIDQIFSTHKESLGFNERLIVEDVNVHDFQEMLKAMDNAIDYVLNPPPSHTICCVLRAADALSCENLAEFSRKLLRGIWSAELSRITATPIPYAQETIVLARQLCISDILKRAFYELLRDGDSRDALSEDDQHRLHTAHGELQMAWAGFIWTMPNSHAFQCHGTRSGLPSPSQVCLARADHDRFQTWRDLLEEYDLFTPHDPLDGLQRLVEIDWVSRGYCMDCVKGRREVFTKKREELWNRLDGWLHL